MGIKVARAVLKVTAIVTSFWLVISFWHMGNDSIAHANEVILLVLNLKVWVTQCAGDVQA